MSDMSEQISISKAQYDALLKAAELLKRRVDIAKSELDLNDIPDNEILNRKEAQHQLRKHVTNWFGNSIVIVSRLEALGLLGKETRI